MGIPLSISGVGDVKKSLGKVLALGITLILLSSENGIT